MTDRRGCACGSRFTYFFGAGKPDWTASCISRKSLQLWQSGSEQYGEPKGVCGCEGCGSGRDANDAAIGPPVVSVHKSPTPVFPWARAEMCKRLGEAYR